MSLNRSSNSNIYDTDSIIDLFADSFYIAADNGHETHTNACLINLTDIFHKLFVSYVDLISSATNQFQGSVKANPLLLAYRDLQLVCYLVQCRALAATTTGYQPNADDILTYTGYNAYNREEVKISKFAEEIYDSLKPETFDTKGYEEIFVQIPLISASHDVKNKISDFENVNILIPFINGMIDAPLHIANFLYRYLGRPSNKNDDDLQLCKFQSATKLCHDTDTARCVTSGNLPNREYIVPYIDLVGGTRHIRNPFHLTTLYLIENFEKVITTHPTITELSRRTIKVINDRMAADARIIRGNDYANDNDPNYNTFYAGNLSEHFPASTNAETAKKGIKRIEEMATTQHELFKKKFSTYFKTITLPTSTKYDASTINSYPVLRTGCKSEKTHYPLISEMRQLPFTDGMTYQTQHKSSEEARDTLFVKKEKLTTKINKDIAEKFFKATKVGTAKSGGIRTQVNWFVKKVNGSSKPEFSEVDKISIIDNLLGGQFLLSTDDAYRVTTPYKVESFNNLRSNHLQQLKILTVVTNQAQTVSDVNIPARLGYTISDVEVDYSSSELKSKLTVSPEHDYVNSCAQAVEDDAPITTLEAGNVLSGLITQNQLHLSSGSFYHQCYLHWKRAASKPTVYNIMNDNNFTYNGCTSYPIRNINTKITYLEDFKKSLSTPYAKNV